MRCGSLPQVPEHSVKKKAQCFSIPSHLLPVCCSGEAKHRVGVTAHGLGTESSDTQHRGWGAKPCPLCPRVDRGGLRGTHFSVPPAPEGFTGGRVVRRSRRPPSHCCPRRGGGSAAPQPGPSAGRAAGKGHPIKPRRRPPVAQWQPRGSEQPLSFLHLQPLAPWPARSAAVGL